MTRHMSSISQAALLAYAVLLGSGCGQHPRIDVSVGIENGQVVFNVPFGDMNGLLDFAVCEGKKTVWAVSLPYERGHRIVYGLIPTGGNTVAKQTLPPVGEPLPDIRGKTITVCVGYQYDSGFAPCTGHFEKVVAVPQGPADGTGVEPGDIPSMR